MSLIRGTALAGYPDLVADLGADPVPLLHAAGISARDVGEYEVFVSYPGVVKAIESAAASTGARDFGRRLALRQGIDILGPVGVAARTSPTVAGPRSQRTAMSRASPSVSAVEGRRAITRTLK